MCSQDIQDLPWFVVGYDFYPTSCVFSIPEPWHHMYNMILTIHPVSVVYCHAKDANIISTILHLIHRDVTIVGYEKFIQWVISTGYVG